MATLKYWDANTLQWKNISTNIVGAVPSTRTINFKSLATDIILTSYDISGNAKSIFDIKSISSSATLTLDDYTVLVSGDTTVFLPPASDFTGKVYNIKKIDAAGTTVTIQGDGTELIDDSNIKNITIQYTSLTIQSDGTQWWII